MRCLIILFSLFLSFSIVGQTTADFVSCLELIFEQREFEPAYRSDLSTNGQLIILNSTANFTRTSEPRYKQRLRELLQEDFHASNRRIKVLQEEEFEASAIPKSATLQINGAGDDQKININLFTNISDERKRYYWTYILDKENGEWVIRKHSLTKSAGHRSPR